MATSLLFPFANYFLSNKSPVSLGRYFLRRLTRIEPPYVAAMLLLFALKVIWGRGSILGLAPHLAASMAYLHNLIYQRPSDIDFVAWSLEIEVQFYILAPFLAALLFRIEDRFRRLTCTVVVILLAALLADIVAPSVRLNLSIIGQLPYFLSGLLLADVWSSSQIFRTQALFWDIAGVTTFGLIFVWMFCGQQTVNLAGPLTVFATYYSVFRSVLIKRLLSLSPIATIGGMCYSIYLLHNYIIAFCGMHSERLSVSLSFGSRLTIQLIIIAPAILVFAGAFFVIIERPCMQPDWPRRLKDWCTDLKLGKVDTREGAMIHS